MALFHISVCHCHTHKDKTNYGTQEEFNKLVSPLMSLQNDKLGVGPGINAFSLKNNTKSGIGIKRMHERSY
jgi:hypothetical protein